MSIPIMDFVYRNLTIKNLLIHQNDAIVEDLNYTNYSEYLCSLNKHFEARHNEPVTGPY